MKEIIAIILVIAGLAASIFYFAPDAMGENASIPATATTSSLIPLRVNSQKPVLVKQTAKFEAGSEIMTETSYTRKTIVTVTSVYECDAVTSLK